MTHESSPDGSVIWITWNNSRRSRSLSHSLGIPLTVYDFPWAQPPRQLLGAVMTVTLLAIHRPRKVFVQYSWLLLILIRAYQACRGGRVMIVCDCHNKALQREPRGVGRSLFVRLKRWSLAGVREAWVSNEALTPLLGQFAVRARIVPDPPPMLTEVADRAPRGHVAVVGSYAVDEPIEEIIAAARLVPDIPIRMTGRVPSSLRGRVLPPNIQLTGFLSDADYFALLFGAQAIVCLSTDPSVLQCGAHESVEVNRPLVLSDSPVARVFFGQAAVYVVNRAEAIAAGMRSAIGDSARILAASLALRAKRHHDHAAMMREIRRDLL